MLSGILVAAAFAMGTNRHATTCPYFRSSPALMWLVEQIQRIVLRAWSKVDVNIQRLRFRLPSAREPYYKPESSHCSLGFFHILLLDVILISICLWRRVSQRVAVYFTYACNCFIEKIMSYQSTLICLLTLPCFACHAKKYRSAASGWPTKQKLTQKIQLPTSLPFMPCIFSKGSVPAISGI